MASPRPRRVGRCAPGPWLGPAPIAAPAAGLCCEVGLGYAHVLMLDTQEPHAQLDLALLSACPRRTAPLRGQRPGQPGLFRDQPGHAGPAQLPRPAQPRLRVGLGGLLPGGRRPDAGRSRHRCCLARAERRDDQRRQRPRGVVRQAGVRLRRGAGRTRRTSTRPDRSTTSRSPRSTWVGGSSPSPRASRSSSATRWAAQRPAPRGSSRRSHPSPPRSGPSTGPTGRSAQQRARRSAGRAPPRPGPPAPSASGRSSSAFISTRRF